MPNRAMPLVATLFVVGCAAPLRINDMQVVGSHNSYKQHIDPVLWQVLLNDNPALARGLDYGHLPLTEQLDHGLRLLELDVFYDPYGGRFASPGGHQRLVELGHAAPEDHDPYGRMAAPGFKVLHIENLDYRSSCLTLQLCLTELRAWSEANPRHVPVVITMNAKEETVETPRLVRRLQYDTAAWTALDEEIVRGLGRERLIVPDDVRGDRDSLEQAVLEDGWPELEWARGRFLVVLDAGPGQVDSYLQGHPALAGRVLFANAREGSPAAAVRIVNEPVGKYLYIRRLVRSGYLVRTRADAETLEARSNSTRRRAAAFNSGAHAVTTDYYVPDERFGTGYQVELPGGGVARCNPVRTEACRIEE